MLQVIQKDVKFYSYISIALGGALAIISFCKLILWECNNDDDSTINFFNLCLGFLIACGFGQIWISIYSLTNNFNKLGINGIGKWLLLKIILIFSILIIFFLYQFFADKPKSDCKIIGYRARYLFEFILMFDLFFLILTSHLISSKVKKFTKQSASRGIVENSPDMDSLPNYNYTHYEKKPYTVTV